ncbi:MAG: BCD family MFS transporter [Pseudomonadota bacterium]
MNLGWGGILRLCLVNAAIGGMAALPVNLFNRLMTVELSLPALLPGLLVAVHYGVQITRPVWGHRSDARGGRTPFILGGVAAVGLGLILVAWAIVNLTGTAALLVWIFAYILIGLGIGAAGTSFLALLATATHDDRKSVAATLAWLMLIIGAIAASIGAGQALEPYSPARLMAVVPIVSLVALLMTLVAVWRVEARLGPVPPPAEPDLKHALRAAWADPAARGFTGFVFLSIFAFYLSELVLEPFMGHVHGLTPDASTTLSGGKDGAALLGMLAAGGLAFVRVGSLRAWAVIGCLISAVGLVALAIRAPLMPSVMTLGLGNGLFVVGAVGSMMRLAAAKSGAAGTRMGLFGAAQAIAAGLAGMMATGLLDIGRLWLTTETAYAFVFVLEAIVFVAAAIMAGRLLTSQSNPKPSLQPGE